jgi:acetyl-CoA carboxylase carboxyltransferase component
MSRPLAKAAFAATDATSQAGIDGRTVGVIANQPKCLGGALDAASASRLAWAFRSLQDSR